MSGLLQGHTVLITGSSKGIGSAIALQFAKEKASLILAARSADKLKEVRRNGMSSCL